MKGVTGVVGMTDWAQLRFVRNSGVLCSRRTQHTRPPSSRHMRPQRSSIPSTYLLPTFHTPSSKVLDDSTKAHIRDKVDAAALVAVEGGHPVQVMRRTNRQGYKAGEWAQ